MKNIIKWINEKRLERKGNRRSESTPESIGSIEERAKMLDRCLDAPSVKIEIPDPWDDPLM